MALAPQLKRLGGTGHRRAALGESMEPVESRSDTRNKLIPASPGQVFAAMQDPARLARWWGPAGFTNTIHKYEFTPGGSWLLTMHGPDGKDYPNESRFTRIVPGQLFEIEHLNGHHFVLTLELRPDAAGTNVMWRQTFDTAEHYERLAEFVTVANEQNLERLAAEVVQGKGAA
jgi:uncharacterized protein YndB with AHSA1/START domain